ncbi:MAG: DUF4271 domain-containing protein [Bacteroidota bacterium]
MSKKYMRVTLATTIGLLFFVSGLFQVGFPVIPQAMAGQLSGSDVVVSENNSQEKETTTQDFFNTPHNLVPRDKTYQPLPLSNQTDNTWIGLLLLMALSFLALARFYFPGRVEQFLKAVLSKRFFYLLERESTLFRETPAYLLFLNFLLVATLLLYQTLSYFDLMDAWMHVHPAVICAIIFCCLLVFYVVKIMAVMILAWVFSTRRATIIYLENIFVFNFFTGLILLPLVFYHALNVDAYGLYISWLVVIVANVVKVFRGSLNGYKASGFSVYYLFLYLCGVEIAPLLFIVKGVSAYLLNN